MSCEICGRGNCTRSFHSLEDQNSFDNIADDIKDKMRNHLASKIDRLDYEEINGFTYIRLDEAIDIIENY